MAQAKKRGSEGSAGGRKAFLLRLPPPLYAELKAWAAHDLRSLNGQIEFLLREALKRHGRATRERDSTDE